MFIPSEHSTFAVAYTMELRITIHVTYCFLENIDQ